MFFCCQTEKTAICCEECGPVRGIIAEHFGRHLLLPSLRIWICRQPDIEILLQFLQHSEAIAAKPIAVQSQELNGMGDVARSHARLGTFGIVWLKRTVGSCHTKQPGESWKLKWIQCLRIRNRRPLFCPAGWFPVACKTLAVSWRFFVANVMYAPCTNRKEIIPVKMPVLLLRGRRLRDKMLDAEIAVSQINLAVGTQSLLVTPKLDGDLFSYAYFSKHVANESSFGIPRPQPALCRWNRGLETRTSHPTHWSPPASCRRNAGLTTTATVDLHQRELSNRQSTGTRPVGL